MLAALPIHHPRFSQPIGISYSQSIQSTFKRVLKESAMDNLEGQRSVDAARAQEAADTKITRT